MELRTLTRDELKALHAGILKRAFPPDELKPFSAMDGLLKKGCYDAWALEDGGEAVSWALCWHSPRCALVDYFVTAESRRGQGLGAEMLDLLARRYLPQRPLIVETEVPEDRDPARRELQRRRLDYYLRQGFREAGFEVLLFGVHYRVLVRGECGDAQGAYLELYRDGTSPFFRKRFLKILEGNT